MASREIFMKNLLYYMNIAGINQIELANKVGVSKSTVSTWLSGRSYPRIDAIQKIADVLNCETDDLVAENMEVTRQQISEDEKILFRLARNAKPEALRAAVAVLKSMEDTNNEF